MSSIAVPLNIQLADPEFYKSKPIDLLIGAEVFWQLIMTNNIPQTQNHPHFQETQLGWIAGGAVNHKTSNLTACHLSTSALESQVAKFWEVEELTNKAVLSEEDLATEQYFLESYSRQKNGRFTVSLPFKNNKVSLGNSREVAEKRFYNLKRKLNNQVEIKSEYVKFLKEYEELGHMQLVPEQELNKADCCYLPHHPVIKNAAVTTKLRVVFDASSKSANGQSLNDNLLAGPNLQQELVCILTRFRLYKYVFCGDIEKMYGQISLKKKGYGVSTNFVGKQS